tara:strand:- start:922 stop:1311 length:390 start_codon:yes stop_codon:yes gene_type:complete
MFEVQVKAGTQHAKMLKLVDSRKRKMLVSFVSPGMRETAPGWWDGGSREEQMRVEYDSHNNLMVHHAPQITNPFAFKRDEGFPTVEINDRQGLLSVGTFCGKPRIPHLLCTEEFYYKSVLEIELAEELV